MNKYLTNKEGVNPFEADRIVVCSYDFARRQERYLRLAHLDLVVLDEAHRLRNVYRPDNQTGYILKNALTGKKKILLTATPLQNSLLELYGLTSFIDKYAFGDLKSFKSRYKEPFRGRLRPTQKASSPSLPSHLTATSIGIYPIHIPYTYASRVFAECRGNRVVQSGY